MLETVGESGLYEGHLSLWPTGCPKFIQMTADERYEIVFKGRFCRSCLSPNVIFTAKHLDECNIRKKVWEKEKSPYTCAYKKCAAHVWVCKFHKGKNRPAIQRAF